MREVCCTIAEAMSRDHGAWCKVSHCFHDGRFIGSLVSPQARILHMFGKSAYVPIFQQTGLSVSCAQCTGLNPMIPISQRLLDYSGQFDGARISAPSPCYSLPNPGSRIPAQDPHVVEQIHLLKEISRIWVTINSRKWMPRSGSVIPQRWSR